MSGLVRGTLRWVQDAGEPPKDGLDGVAPSALLAWMAEHAPGNRWSPFRGLDRLDPGMEAEAQVAALRDGLADPTAVPIVQHHKDRVGAVTVLRPKDMESRCFGIPTAGVTDITCPQETPERAGVVGHLLRQVVDRARDLGHQLLVMRVDADDAETLSAAQEEGFRVHECTLTFLLDSHAQTPVRQRPDLTVDVHEGDVAGALSPPDVERLAAASAQWQLSHYGADPRLRAEVVERYYREWMHNIASGDWSDCLFVARRGDEVIGAKSENTDHLVSDVLGSRFRVGGFMVVTEAGRGAGGALIDVASHHRHPGGRWRSWDTQARNLSTIRRIEECGAAQLIGSTYTLHGWPAHGAT